MIRQRKLKNIANKIRKHTKHDPPLCNNPDLPKIYNIVLSASPKGGGKTYNCVELLTAYENAGFKSPIDMREIKMRTIWVAGGTANSKNNSILDSLKSLNKDDRIDIEDSIEEQLNDLYDDLLAEKLAIEEYNEYVKIYDKYEKSKDFKNLTDDELFILGEKEFINPLVDNQRPRDKNGQILHHPRVVFMILDDLIGSTAFSNSRSNFLNKLAIKSRHDSDKLVPINLFFITQSFKSIPAVIRRQTDYFVLLKSASRSIIIDAISEEVGSHFTKEDIEKYYDYTSNISYGALILSIHKKEKDENRVRLGWDTILEI